MSREILMFKKSNCVVLVHVMSNVENTEYFYLI